MSGGSIGFFGGKWLAESSCIVNGNPFLEFTQRGHV